MLGLDAAHLRELRDSVARSNDPANLQNAFVEFRGLLIRELDSRRDGIENMFPD